MSMLKKILYLAAAFLYSLLLFLALPRIPLFEQGADAAAADDIGRAVTLFIAGAAIYGLFLALLADNRDSVLIGGALFAAFAWSAGMLYPALTMIGGLLLLVPMAIGALIGAGIRFGRPFRWIPEHKLRKILFACAAAITLIALPVLWRVCQPDNMTSMARDSRDYTFILFVFSLYSLIFGSGTALAAGADRAYTAAVLSGYFLIGGISLHLTGISSGFLIFFYLPVLIIGFLIGRLIQSFRALSHGTKEN